MVSTTPHTSVDTKRVGKAATDAMPRWQRWLVWCSFLSLAGSGLLWLLLFAEGNDATGLPLYAAAKLWSMRVHAAAALLTVLAVGSLLTLHIPQGWRRARNKRTGLSNLMLLGCLALTGYLLGYASEGWIRQGSVWCHWLLGVGAPLVLAAHVWLPAGRRAPRVSANRPPPTN